jgi:hypothetical protein
MYVHPWEFDPHQPRLATGLISRLRTYTGLAGMDRKIRSLLTDFKFSTMGGVHLPVRSETTRSLQAEPLKSVATGV